MVRHALLPILLSGAGLACSGSGGDGGASGTGTGTSGGSTSGAATDSAGTSAGATSAGKEDLPEPDGECLLYQQDCTDPALKCMPWSLEEDRIPDETKCCPMVANPKQIDETCEIMDYDGSCLDDCDEGAFCVLEQSDALGGFCHKFCDPGDESTCDADETCKPFFEMIEDAPEVPICMDKCDPLTQDCQRPGWSCLPDSPTTAGQSGFICTPPPPQNPGQQGDTCALANDCDIGLTCVPSSRLPECGFLFCCTQFCDLTEADPCPAIDPALECVDWMAPDPQWQDVGVCAIPA